RGSRSRSPTTKSSLLLRPASAAAKLTAAIPSKIFITDIHDGERVLPRPVSAGLMYAACVSDFDPLSERDIWALRVEDKTFISVADVDRIYAAKCEDQHCAVNAERQQRFRELVGDQCRGERFILRQCGLGIESCRVICDILERDNIFT